MTKYKYKSECCNADFVVLNKIYGKDKMMVRICKECEQRCFIKKLKLPYEGGNKNNQG
jgi:hypothetical protein